MNSTHLFNFVIICYSLILLSYTIYRVVNTYAFLVLSMRYLHEIVCYHIQVGCLLSRPVSLLSIEGPVVTYNGWLTLSYSHVDSCCRYTHMRMCFVDSLSHINRLLTPRAMARLNTLFLDLLFIVYLLHTAICGAETFATTSK